MVSVSALLALANWLEVRKKSIQEEGICLTARTEHRQAGVKKRGRSTTSSRATLGGDSGKHTTRHFTGIQSNSSAKLARTPSQHKRGAK